MNDKQTPPRCLYEWGARWLLTAQMALAFARCLLRLSEKDPRRALQTADMFELWLMAAAAKLACEITANDTQETDGLNARKLYGALHVFVLLTHFVRYLKLKYSEMVAKLPVTGWVLPRAVCVRTAPITEPAFIDSS